MIERIKLDLVTPNLPKDNEAIDLSRMEEAARDMGFAAIERTLMVFGPGGWGGNHMHERREASVFYTILGAALGKELFGRASYAL